MAIAFFLTIIRLQQLRYELTLSTGRGGTHRGALRAQDTYPNCAKISYAGARLASMAITTVEGDAQSEVSGVNSSRSSGSRKYRVVSRESKVDESLFASKTTANRNNDCQRERRRAFAGDVPPNATVITEAELSKIKQRSVITTLADEEASRTERERVLQDKQCAARARKQRMLEVEVQAKQKAPKSDIEVEQTARDHMVRKLAGEKMDANNDLVKMLNSLGARAAAFTIRDKQLAEKTRREEAEKAYEKRMDMIVEVTQGKRSVGIY